MELIFKWEETDKYNLKSKIYMLNVDKIKEKYKGEKRDKK